MIWPESLKPGDTILLVAPARKVTEAEMATSVQQLRKAGFNVITSDHLFGSDHQYSGTDTDRLHDLQWALDHPFAKAVLCARGGYGTLRILDRLNWTNFKKHPKWVAGYSDITVLLAEVNRKGVVGIHSTMPINFGKDEASVQSLFKVLSGQKPEYTFPVSKYQRTGTARGVLTGGNLSLLYALQGSGTFPDMKGKILFLEDLDEYLYHIDRMMISLKRSGTFQDLAGLLVGGMTEMKDNPIPFGKSAEQIILETVGEYSFPVGFGFPAGHILSNHALVMGGEVELNISQDGSRLKFLP